MGVVDQRADDALLGGYQRFEADRRGGYEEEHGDHEPWRGLYQLREPGVQPGHSPEQTLRKEACEAFAAEDHECAERAEGGILIQPSVVAAEDGEHRQKADEAEQQQRGEGSFLRVGRVAVGFPEGEEEVAEEVVDQKHHQEPHGDDEPGGVAVAEVVVEMVGECLAHIPGEGAESIKLLIFDLFHAGKRPPAFDDGERLLHSSLESRHEGEQADQKQRAARAPKARLPPREQQQQRHRRSPEKESLVEEDSEREEKDGADDPDAARLALPEQEVDDHQKADEHEILADDLGERAEKQRRCEQPPVEPEAAETAEKESRHRYKRRHAERADDMERRNAGRGGEPVDQIAQQSAAHESPAIVDQHLRISVAVDVGKKERLENRPRLVEKEEEDEEGDDGLRPPGKQVAGGMPEFI